MINALTISNVFEKIKVVEGQCHQLLLNEETFDVPTQISRDIQLIGSDNPPTKEKLSTKAGQAKLLHDLANIELQAMELCLRSLIEYPNAPVFFREQLTNIALDEKLHLELCLEEIQNLGFQWGDWPIHTMLWDATKDQDDLLTRILIVHRYLEGSGLDASDEILKKLSGLVNKRPRDVVKKIATDEVQHVEFGSIWFSELCKQQNLNRENEFSNRLSIIYQQVPKRSAKINHKLRKHVGFTDEELHVLNLFHQKKNNNAPFLNAASKESP